MHSKIAAARAFETAGNHAQALKQIEEVLAEQPQNNNALDVYCDVMRHLGRAKETQSQVEQWLARAPSDIRAAMNLLAIFVEQRDKRNAKMLLATFEQSSKDPDNIELFRACYNTRFGNSDEGFQGLAAHYGKSGDKAGALRSTASAAVRQERLLKAYVLGEAAVQAGDRSAGALALMSMLAYRTFRFSKCRFYAREALKADPTLPIPRELIWMSWVVLFPPFLLAQALLFILSLFPKNNSGYIVALAVTFPLVTPVVAPFVALCSWLLSLVGLDLGFFKTFLLTIGFALYQPFIGRVSPYLKGGRKRNVKLGDY
jgi:tetratricopeptide (TPR) repeat protein